MGTAVSVKQLLKSVCDDTRWNYAVFWRLIEDGSSMLLSWADGYWDYPNSHTGASVSKNSMELMSGLLHTYGEGIVGRVASTGTYSWIFFDNVISEENYVGTWHLHFGTGIKTVLLVPIFPHGVLQLGSLDVMSPDPMVVGHVMSLFMLQDRHFSLTSYPYGEELSMVSGFPDMNQTKVLMNDASSHVMSVMPSMFPAIGFDIKQPQEDIQCFVDVLGIRPTYDDNSMDLGIGNETIDDKSVCMFSTPEREVIHYHLFDEFSAMPHPWEGYQEQESSKDSSIFANNTGSSWDAVEQPQDDRGAEIMDYQLIDSPLSFDIETELQAVFAPATEVEDDPLLWTEKSGMSEVEGFFRPDIQIIDPFLEEYFTDASAVEPVLVASVANIDSSSEDDISFTITDEKTPPKPLRKIAKSWQMESVCDHKSSEISSLTRQSLVEAEPFRAAIEAPPVSCPSGSGSSEENADTVVNGVAHKFDVGHSSSRKCPKSRKPDGRKGRKADVHRQRPKDRQMIQDRIKELREIVPGGEKCSIDALLERAANHMHFLRSVTSQAEKLSKCRQSKEVQDEKLNKTPPSDSNRGGFAQRSQPEIFPITVENLDHPEHILVEVLCEEQSLFLEIAQVIRRLKLTILEGVMETRSDHRWACFIVETPRGFQQVEIVWPLMQLLQTKRGMRF